MRFLVPTLAETRAMITRGAAIWQERGYACDEDALPPAFVFERALGWMAAHPGTDDWFSPRLFLADNQSIMVGSGGCKTPPAHPAGVEIGYGVAARHRGQGHATQAVTALVREIFGHAAVLRIYADVLPDNLASARVLAKCGFTRKEGMMHPEDGWLDRYEILR